MFLVGVLRLIEEEFVELEVFAGVGVAQRVRLDVFQEVARELGRVVQLEQVLDAPELFVVSEHEKILVLLVFRQILEPVQGVVGFEEGRPYFRIGWGTLRVVGDGLPLHQGQEVAVDGEGDVVVVVAEKIAFVLVEKALFLIHAEIVERIK